MADIDWPAGLVPYKVMYYLQPHVGGQESPLTRTRKVYGLSAPRWIARLTFRAGHGYEAVGIAPRGGDPAFAAARLDALIAELEGGLNKVRFHDFRRPRPQHYLSNYANAVAAASVSAGSRSISIHIGEGKIGPSIGDYIGGDGRPHIITDVSPRPAGGITAIAPASGIVTAVFKPPLSAAIAAGAPIEMTQVTARFDLQGDDAGQNESEVGTPTDYVLDFSEALP